jgi:hypothetical protein
MSENVQVWVILIALVCVVAVAYLVALRGSPRAESDSTFSAHVSGPYDETIRILPELPRPRAIRMSGKGKSMGLALCTSFYDVVLPPKR